ncbi:MAG: ATP-dependent RNA helicase HrpA [Deltaproteobacteria bacterium]|nr:ATP-dependent RNA helicase HrpA [Deltaproteobacteria bacterium]
MARSAPRQAPSRIDFPRELPISARIDELTRTISKHQVIIVAGATGSGKTTQLPKLALTLGRGLDRLIGVTQPRRIAATSMAARVAAELDCSLGSTVGYQIRFDERTSSATSIKFMTDGILLAEIHRDRKLNRYDTLVIDEAHERNLTIDFLLGWIKRILPERPDLKIIVSSATIETDRFSEFFGGAPVVRVEGRAFPVDVLYEPPGDDDDLAQAVADSVEEVSSLDPHGDILVFLPGEREIREAEAQLVSRRLRHTVIQPLYSRLAASDQNKVFAPIRGRRVVLATNVAETSLTLPGIVYVIDTGTARLSRYDPRSGTTRLQVEAISRASAEQRKGRCGRVRDGVCIRLYDEQSFAARPEFTDPEIKRTGLAGVILRMKDLELGEVDDFPFIDPPHPRSISEGYRVLEELGAIDVHRELTPIGRQLARFPVDPRISRMILAGAELGCLSDVLVVTAALNSQDPRERPRDAQQKADEAHRKFSDESSDFSGLLKLWEFVKQAEQRGSSNLRRTCRESFLSFMRVREWTEVHRQLLEIVRELRLDRRHVRAPDDTGEPLHRALLTGLLSKVGTYSAEKRVYLGAKQTRFLIHPSSALSKKTPAWIMAFELVETSQLFARTAAKIQPEWLLEAAPELVKRSYSEPHWSEKSARAMVKESATLFGLQVFRDRAIEYASIDPRAARTLFLDHALVRGEYRSRGRFQEKNRAMLAELALLRDKARQSDMLADADAILEFFDRRVAPEVTNGKTFEAWREVAEKTHPRLLELTIEDVLAGDSALAATDYPDELVLHGTKVQVSYRFDPSAEDDGITLTLPLVLLPQLDASELHWTIRGWHREKLELLLDDLPKSFRRELGPSRDVAEALAGELTPFSGPMVPALARVLRQLTGVDVPPSAFRPDAAPPYLRSTFRLLDAERKVIAQSRDFVELRAKFGSTAKALWRNTVLVPDWERAGLTTWSFGELPEFVTRSLSGIEVRSYPALVDKQTCVDLTLLESEGEAERASLCGVRRLLMLGARSAIGAIKPRLPAPFARVDGKPTPKDDQERFRAMLLERIFDEAHELRNVPRSKAAFDTLGATGSPKIHPTFLEFEAAMGAVSSELGELLGALKTAARHPSGKASLDDIREQLEALFPADLMSWIPLGQLGHFPRYLRAAKARLGRAVTDPRKDLEKARPFNELWDEFLEKQPTARARQAARELRWTFEELRVAVFAPELKPAMPVSLQKVQAALRSLS